MELKKYKLADIAKIEISGVDKKTIEGEIPVRLCNFVDVYHNWAITKDKAEHFMLASAKQAEIDKCSIAKGQVAITKDSETRDDIGIATYFADDFDNVVLGYHCALITPAPTIVDGKYLNAFMHTKYIQKYFENNASGSGQRYVRMNMGINGLYQIVRTEMELPPLGGAVFIFFPKNRQQVKMLKWDGDGFLLYQKRLERGTFDMTTHGKGRIGLRCALTC